MAGTEYYDSTGAPATGSQASSSIMRAEFDAIQAGFGKLPDLSGNANKIVTVNAGATALTAVGADTLTATAGAVAFKKLAASATGTNATVTVTADEVVLSTTGNAYKTARSVSLSINTAASGANGLDTGSLAATTWYSVWVIYNPTTDTVAGLISTSETAPTMPSGYTYKARIGWTRTDGTGNKYPLGFTQKGQQVRYLVAAGGNVTAPRTMATGVAALWTAAAWADYAPSTISAIMVGTYMTGSPQSYYIAPNSSYTSANAPVSVSNINGSARLAAPIHVESANIYWAHDGAVPLFCYGWEDNL